MINITGVFHDQRGAGQSVPHLSGHHHGNRCLQCVTPTRSGTCILDVFLVLKLYPIREALLTHSPVFILESFLGLKKLMHIKYAYKQVSGMAILLRYKQNSLYLSNLQ